MMDADCYKRGMRRLAAGVCVITTVAEGVRHGLVATSVCSVSLDPPSLLICVNQEATSHAAIRNAGIFCVNILSAADHAIAQRFSSPEHREIRFSDRAWDSLATGAPALVGALASFDCRVTDAVSVATHTVFMAHVVDARLSQEQVEPLVYFEGRFRLGTSPDGEPLSAFPFDPGWG